MKRQPACKRSHLEAVIAEFRPSGASEVLLDMFWRLYDHFGPQYWWPGQTPFEIAVGAILTQNTNWQNVEKAIDNLKKQKILEPQAILELPPAMLAGLIRPAGYYNIKAKRLKCFVKFLEDVFQGSMDLMAQAETTQLRQMLLEIHGIGPETADSILLYALGKPVFVVDAYTVRVLSSHELIDPALADYHEIQELFMDNLPVDTCLFNEFHALYVRLGKEFCKKRRPVCHKCPLKDI